MMIPKESRTSAYQYKLSRGFLNRKEYLMNVISAPEYYNILEGRTCIYENELVLTQLAADELGIGIGDDVKLGIGDKEKEFIISGIYQSRSAVTKHALIYCFFPETSCL